MTDLHWILFGFSALCFVVAVLLWRADQKRTYKPLDRTLWTDWEREQRRAQLRKIQAPGLSKDRKEVS